MHPGAEWRAARIRSRFALHVYAHDPSGDRTVPSMVIRRAQIGLIHGAADEVVDGFVIGQQVLQRVGLCLDPESVLTLHSGGKPVRCGFTRTDHYRVIVGCGNRPLILFETSGEEVVPGRETPELVVRVVLELMHPDRALCCVGFPSVFGLVDDIP